ncbi:MAG: RDD family protein [Deltaproteobacteria bacterium]|nr:RDD family protein [Deltaproteobacteria bacterium]
MTYSYYGGFWRRGIAFSIDKVILQLISITICYIGAKVVVPDYDLTDLSSILPNSLLWSFYGITIILDMVYFTYFHGTTGQTPGKKILGLKVIQKRGEPMTLGIAFLRWVGYLISKIFLYLGFIWIAFNREKMGWHDMIAGTCVVKTEESRQAAKPWREGGISLGPTLDSSSTLASSHKNRSQWCVEEERKANMEHISKILDKRKEIG